LKVLGMVLRYGGLAGQTDGVDHDKIDSDCTIIRRVTWVVVKRRVPPSRIDFWKINLGLNISLPVMVTCSGIVTRNSKATILRTL
jgi:hypothetical protein